MTEYRYRDLLEKTKNWIKTRKESGPVPANGNFYSLEEMASALEISVEEVNEFFSAGYEFQNIR